MSKRVTGKRAKQKGQSRRRIVRAAARSLREHGVGGLNIADVMAEAGLTHGAFYSHFQDKNDLIEAAFHDALDHREAWFGAAAKRPLAERGGKLLGAYLSRTHRDRPDRGCPFALLAREFADGEAAHRDAFEQELRLSLDLIAGLLDDETESADIDTAIGLLSACVGGIMLARAVNSPKLSDRILRAARQFGERALTPGVRATEQRAKP